MDDITFEKLNESFSDYDLIYNWCRNKEIYEWFEQRILTTDEIYSKYYNKIHNSKQTLLFIKSKNKPIGLIQYYKTDYLNENELNQCVNVFEFDLFIGEADCLSKGLGKTIADKLNNLLFVEENADAIVLRPFKRNIRAIKCYLKCGFQQIEEYDDVDTIGNPERYIVLVKYKN